MEERRLAAAHLLRVGKLPQAEIARRLGVSRASVTHWKCRLEQEGVACRHGGRSLPVASSRGLVGVAPGSGSASSRSARIRLIAG